MLFDVDVLPSLYRSMRYQGMGGRNGGGFLWLDSSVYVRDRGWLCALFVGGQVSGPCGLRILGCGWLS